MSELQIDTGGENRARVDIQARAEDGSDFDRTKLTLSSYKNGTVKSRMDLENGDQTDPVQDNPDLLEFSIWADGHVEGGHKIGIVGRETHISMYAVDPDRKTEDDYVKSSITVPFEGPVAINAIGGVQLNGVEAATIQISTTEPTITGGFWFNPETGALHVHTGDA